MGMIELLLLCDIWIINIMLVVGTSWFLRCAGQVARLVMVGLYWYIGYCIYSGRIVD